MISSTASVTDQAGGKSRKPRFHASLTASESSTIAEEVVVLLRRLHVLPAWNPLINQFISSSLQTIPSIILAPSTTTGGVGTAGDIKEQVCFLYEDWWSEIWSYSFS